MAVPVLNEEHKALFPNINKKSLTILYNNKFRTQFLPRLKSWVSLLRIS